MKFFIFSSLKWGLWISGITFILAVIFSVMSTMLLENVAWGMGMLIVFVIILIGVIFDMLGLASASAKETPFHAMASEKIIGSKEAISIIRNADRFSSFCNDVVGDVCGVISGAASAIVIINLVGEGTAIHTVSTVIFTAFVSALTVGGKALGKSAAIHYSTALILFVGKCFYFFEFRLGIKIFNGKKNKWNNGKRGNKRVLGRNK